MNYAQGPVPNLLYIVPVNPTRAEQANEDACFATVVEWLHAAAKRAGRALVLPSVVLDGLCDGRGGTAASAYLAAPSSAQSSVITSCTAR